MILLVLVFASNFVFPEVIPISLMLAVSRRVDRYDIVKIKQTESEFEAEHSADDSFAYGPVKVGRINQSQCSIPGLVIGWFFRFCVLPSPTI